MIAWPLRAAQASECFDRIIVSTDDAEIAQVARDLGAEVPFIRPPELSDDHCGTTPVIAHATQWVAEQGHVIEEVCCIYATAPFIQPKDLSRGLAILRESGAEYAFSITSYSFPIQRAFKVNSGQRLMMIQPEHEQTRSQDLDEAYHDAGQFYWGRAEAWTSNLPLFGPNSAPVILPRYRVQDIDTPEDWDRAELMFRALKQTESSPRIC